MTDFRDNSGNQPFHFWFYVATAYFDAPAISRAGNFIHDGYATGFGKLNYYTNPIQQILRFAHWMNITPKIHIDGAGKAKDYALGVAGVNLGRNIGWWEHELDYGLRNDSIGNLIVNWLNTNISSAP